jgi:phosphoribosylglycinamide formyltransferase-1
MNQSRLPVAVLVSGSGSNLQAIIEATAQPDFGAEIVVVISDRRGVYGLDRAAAANLRAVVVPWDEFDDRDRFTEAVCDVAADHGARALVLAGFMRILAPGAIRRFPNRILNIHPALLPSFPGAHAVPQALAHGVRLTGATVHFVDEEVDHGPIISQEAVPVLDGDDETALHARIQEVEHRLLPEALDALARGRLRVTGRHVIWENT